MYEKKVNFSIELVQKGMAISIMKIISKSKSQAELLLVHYIN